MKNYLRLSIAAAMATFTVPVMAGSVSMCAGQSSDIGDIAVSNDATNLYVEFAISEPGWYLAETHVAVSDDSNDIPLNKKGNPVPGKFPYACTLSDSLQQGCIVTIPLEELDGDVIDIAAHAAVNELAVDGECSGDPRNDIEPSSHFMASYWPYADEQGLTKGGSPVPNERSDETSTGVKGDVSLNPTGGFYSLGFGGSLTVGFDLPIFNGPGDDVCVNEATGATDAPTTYPLESALVYADDNVAPLDVVSNEDGDGSGIKCFDLGDHYTVGLLEFVDITDPDAVDSNGKTFPLSADAYDVDWVGACYLFISEETAWGAACHEEEGGIGFDSGNWGTYFTYTIEID